jgi:P27 family predicted phage terminase small subunit
VGQQAGTDQVPPEWLNEEAAQVWVRTLSDLPPAADRDVFAIYCSAIADYNQAQRLLNQSGPVMRDAKGNVVPSPLNRVKMTNASVARGLARDLGIGVDASLPPEKPKRYRNARATERTVEGLRRGGRLDSVVDDASIALARTLAEALDRVDPETFPAQLASLARVHLSAIRALRGQSEDDNDSGISDWVATLSGALGDAPES